MKNILDLYKAYYILGTTLHILHIYSLIQSLGQPVGRQFYHACFTEEEAETQRGSVIYPKVK